MPLNLIPFANNGVKGALDKMQLAMLKQRKVIAQNVKDKDYYTLTFAVIADGNQYSKSDGDLDYEENFYILKHTACPAVLTENGFYTNKEDLAILESREGRRAITDLHVEGIVEHSLNFYIRQHGNPQNIVYRRRAVCGRVVVKKADTTHSRVDFYVNFCGFALQRRLF